MRRRAGRAIAASAVLVVVAMPLSGCVVGACSAVGYGYGGPAVLEFADPIDSDVTVSACFGECIPAELVRDDDQRWEVPQEVPYVERVFIGPGSIRTVRVTLTEPDGTLLSDDTYDIPIAGGTSGWFGECPGPFTFEPVEIDLG